MGAEFQGVTDEVLKQLGELGRVSAHGREWVVRDPGLVLINDHLQGCERALEHCHASGEGEPLPLCFYT